MAANNSTVLAQNTNQLKEYSDFTRDLTYQLNRAQAMLSGAKELVYQNAGASTKLMHGVYLVDDAYDLVTRLTSEVGESDFCYQLKTAGEEKEQKHQDICALNLDAHKSKSDLHDFKVNLHALVDEKFSLLLYALAGLREEAQHSEINGSDIAKIESLAINFRHEIMSGL